VRRPNARLEKAVIPVCNGSGQDTREGQQVESHGTSDVYHTGALTNAKIARVPVAVRSDFR
jgi:hypothetical protein